MRKHSESSHWGAVALVSYVPAPLGAALDRLRHAWSTDGTPKAHVTLLPPRPLLASVEVASAAIHEVLQHFQPFQVEFSSIHRFPETNVIYLDVIEGRSSLHELHKSLNSGVLAHAEVFDYLPHLSLSCPLPANLSEAAHRGIERAWNELNVPRRFRLEETVLLWRSPGSEPGQWQRLWARRLGVAVAAASAAHAAVTRQT